VRRKLDRLFRLALRRSTAGPEWQDELRLHLELRAEELIREGWTPEAAYREARRRFGDVPRIGRRVSSIDRGKERAMRQREWWADLVQDAGFAGRALRRNRGFAAIAIATIALGIGATTSILGVVNGVLVRRLPYPAANRLTLVWSTPVKSPGVQWPVSAASFLEIAASSRTLDSVAAFRSWTYTLSDDRGSAAAIDGARVTGGFFAALGATPLLGRTIGPDDDRVGGPRVVVLSHALWMSHFGGDPAVIGRAITLSRERFTVIGVLRRGWHFPRGAELPAGLQFPLRTLLWTPMTLTPAEQRNWGTQNLAVIGLAHPGATPARLADDLGRVRQRVIEQAPPLAALAFLAVPLTVQAEGGSRPTLLLLLGAVGFLLLIACANVSNLLLTRASARSQEIALRRALGASRGRLIRQFLTENLALTGLGGALGVLLAVSAQRALLRFIPATLPRLDDVRLDWPVLATIVLLVVVVGLTFGMVTALHVTRIQSAGGADGLGARTTSGRSGRRLREVIIVAEVAASLILLSGAGVLARSFWLLRAVDPGLETEPVLTAKVLVPSGATFDPARDGPSWLRFFRQLEDRLAAAPGVVAAGTVTSLPLSGAWESTDFQIEGRPPAEPSLRPNAQFAVVSDGYFKALGIPLVAGRWFGPDDRADSAGTVVVSRAFARRYFADGDAIGQRLRIFGPRPATIVGIVGDVRQTTLDLPPEPTLYLPEAQFPAPGLSVAIRGTGSALGLEGQLRAAVAAIDPTVAVSEVLPMDQVLGQSLGQRRFTLSLLGAFALSALALAMIGLYGVIAYAVAARTQEFGIRAALGAKPGAVLRLVVARGVGLAACGIALGIVGAVMIGRLLGGLLYRVRPADPLTVLLTALVLMVVAAAASLIPARRAMRVSPTVALRST
jgi:predicted permease